MNGPKVTSALRRLVKDSDATYQLLFTKLLIERAVARLTHDKLLRDCLVFKGGFVSVSMYNSPRHTTDLDAVLCGKPVDLVLDKIRAAMEVDLDDGVWFQFEKIVDLKTQSEYGGKRLIKVTADF